MLLAACCAACLHMYSRKTRGCTPLSFTTPDMRILVHRHLDMFRLGFIAFGQRHTQHTVLEMGFYLLGVEHIAKLERPFEPAVAALRAADGAGRGLFFLLAFAAYRNRVSFGLDVNVFFRQTRNVHLKRVRVFGFPHINRGHPPEGVLDLAA